MLDGSTVHPDALEASAMRAARYCGEAAAMAVNLAANPERAEIWYAEEEVWRKREEAAVTAIPLDRSLVHQRVLEAGEVSFSNNLIPKRPK